MRRLTAHYDAPVPAATARRALAAAGFAAADIDAYAADPAAPETPGGDLAAEIALRSERLAAEPSAGRVAAIAEALQARGAPVSRAGDIAERVADGRAWLVAVVCPDVRAARARRALVGAAAVDVFVT